MKKRYIIILCLITSLTLLVWFSCNPFQAKNNNDDLNTLENSDVIKGTGDFSLAGFATVNAWGQNGTTGGEGGQTVTATTAEQFLDYISRSEPLIIMVNGMITLPSYNSASESMHSVASDKTIIGVGSNATITNGGLNIGIPLDDNISSLPTNAVHNVIIRNLNFRAAGDDAINIQMYSHHIWIDHCDLTGARDGLLDIKRGSSYITVSWNYVHDHNKTMLLGHDNAYAYQDVGNLKVTYHHNYARNCKTRFPRVRFGEPVHFYNNYHINEDESGYSVASTCDAGIMVEGNFFETVDNPLRIDFDGEPLGRAVERNNVLLNCGNPMKAGGTVEEPGNYYSYTMDNAADIPGICIGGAGVGKIGL